MRPSELRKAARDPHNVELVAAAAAFQELKGSGAITEYKDSTDRRRTLAADNRTRLIDGLYHLIPFYSVRGICFVICPYCNEIHQHGYNSGTTHKGAHCFTEGSGRGYYLECGEDCGSV